MTAFPNLSLPQKLSRLFMVGSDSVDLLDEIEPFLKTGLGGLILFRHHLQPFDTPIELKEHLNQISTLLSQNTPSPLIAIDQEGGQVERLPFWLCSNNPLPIAHGLKNDIALTYAINYEVAQRLRWLGFTVNFTPTVDLNRNPMNPIIGVRAYGQMPDEVILLAKAVMQAHQNTGVLPVAKHFPGHGSGYVDSHLSLPLFEDWHEDELKPFKNLIQEGVEAVLVAHGLYPKLAKQYHADPAIPASLSQPFITHLLREEMNFKGLVFTDDLMMGAVYDHDPVEVALSALQAGADILVYRRAQPEALEVYEALLHRVQRGQLSEAVIDEKVSRILTTQNKFAKKPVWNPKAEELTEEAIQNLSINWAKAMLTEIHHDFISPLPITHHTRWMLIAPDRQTMIHYAPDAKHSPDIIETFQQAGLIPQTHWLYPVNQPIENLPEILLAMNDLQVIVFIAFNSIRFLEQQSLYQKIKTQYPGAKIILASLGMPSDADVLSRPWIHIQLPHYRPSGVQAFAQWLTQSPLSP